MEPRTVVNARNALSVGVGPSITEDVFRFVKARGAPKVVAPGGSQGSYPN